MLNHLNNISLRQLFLSLIVFLLPWQARWIYGFGVNEYSTLSIYAVDVLMLVAILWCWPFPRWWETFKAWSNQKYWIATAVVVVLSLNIIFAHDSFLAGAKLDTLILITLFGITLWQNGKRSHLRTAVVASAVLQAIVIIAQFFSQSIAASTIFGMAEQLPSTLGASVVETASGRWLRAYGTFPHPNILGGFMAISLLLVIDWYFEVYEKFQTWWNTKGVRNSNLWQEPIVRRIGLAVSVLLVVYVLILTGLVLSFSRSAALAALAGGGVYLYKKRKQNKIRATMLGGKLVIIAVAVVWLWSSFLPGLWQTRLNGTERLEVRSTTERLAGYKEALSIFDKNFLAGVGMQNYSLELAVRYPDEPGYTYQPAHNAPLLFLAELGLLGMSLILGALWLVRNTSFNITAINTAVVVLLLVLLFFDHYLWSLHAGLTLWLVAMALVLRQDAT